MGNVRSLLAEHNRAMSKLSEEERQRLADIWVGDYVLAERTQPQLGSSRTSALRVDPFGVGVMGEVTVLIVVCLLTTAAIAWVCFRYRSKFFQGRIRTVAQERVEAKQRYHRRKQ